MKKIKSISARLSTIPEGVLFKRILKMHALLFWERIPWDQSIECTECMEQEWKCFRLSGW